MRYLLLYVLVACMIGVMIPSTLAQQSCEQMGGVKTSSGTCQLGMGMSQGVYDLIQQQILQEAQAEAQAEVFFHIVLISVIIIVATVSAILIIVWIRKTP